VRPGAWTAMLNWYRAAPFDVPELSAPAPALRWTDGLDYQVKVPTQVIWGAKDAVFRPVLVEALKQHTDHLEVHVLAGAGHVPQRDDPETCASLIRSFAQSFL
jgi:epoxide hydrolase 4